MHVVQVLHRYPPALGGAEKHAADLAAFHQSHGDTVTVWASTALDLEAMRSRGHAELAEGCTDGVERFRPLRFPGRRYLFKAMSLVGPPAWRARWLPCNPVMPGMLRAADAFDGPLDAVHAFAFPYSFPVLTGLRLARRRGVPFVLTPFLHLGDPSDPRDRTRRQYTAGPLRWLLRQADHLLVQTPGERAACISLGVCTERITLTGLGIDSADCTGGDRERARQSWGVEPGDVTVGHLANLSVEKGSVDLLSATVGLDVRVTFAGPSMANFEARWRERSRDNMTLLGVLSEPEKRDFYAGIDLFVLPSRSDSFGLVLLEAWANGKPVVAYRAGGPGDLVRHGVDGLLVPCGDVTGLREAVGRLAGDAALRAAYGEAGRLRVRREFARDERLARVRGVLLKMVAGDAAGGS